MTSTWYTTNDATIEITGLQLEVGPVATPFEHRSVGDELLRCKRYFQGYIQYGEYVAGGTGNLGFPYTAFTVPMRASPTFVSDHESKSSNWSFASMQVQGSDLYGYYAYAISYNTTNSNYGYILANKNIKHRQGFEIKSFIEKPTRLTAEKLIKQNINFFTHNK